MSITDKHCHSLFLSPHLDDVVLSCALRLLKESREGKKVLVATIFSDALKFLPGQDLYKGRQNEDRNALNILGLSDPLWLGFRDAPFRNFFYTNFRSIILGNNPQDNSCLEDIAKKVSSLCQELSPQQIFIPLAIGTHIDHRLTHRIWCKLPSDINIIFYEDRPYALLPHSVALRLKEIGAGVSQLSLSQSLSNGPACLKDFAKGLKDQTMYKNVLTRKKDRFRYLLWAARIIASQNKSRTASQIEPQIASQIKPQVTSQTASKIESHITSQINEPILKIEPEIIETSTIEEVAQIENAIAAYKSQLPVLYKNLDTFRRETALYMHTFNSTSLYAERYWKLIR